MKKLLHALFLIFASHTSLPAEVFVGPSSPTNRFVLATGQAALISSIHPRYLYDANLFRTGSVPLTASVIVSNTTNSVYISEFKHGLTALAGPLELVVSNAAAISYRVLTNTAIHSLLVRPGTTNVITVPAGKSIRFFRASLDGVGGITGGNGSVFAYPLISNAELTRGSAVITGVEIYGDAEFDGPLTIRFINLNYDILFPPAPGSPAQSSFTVPYYLTDQAVVLPDQAALASPTGNFEIQIQKSFDLTNWFPSIALPATSESKAFYRLRITK